MYNRQQTTNRNNRRPTFRKGGFRRSGSGGNRNKRSFDKKIDVTKFVNRVETKEVETPYVSKHVFNDFNIEPEVKRNIELKGYVHPTPIQDESIPFILEGRDIVGIANTGTGKTAAFLIPLINKVLQNKQEKVLIVVPTRELAIQIEEEFRSLSKNMNMYAVTCVGGAYIGGQISQLRRQHNFIIGTPGRLIDLVKRKNINLQYFKTVVLDEADRMLDMGFINDVKFLLSHMDKDRHTVFFSATLERSLEGLVETFLNNPVRISVKTRDTSKNVDQDIVRIERGASKAEVLHDLLLQEAFDKVLVFGKTKHGVENLSRSLKQKGFKAESIHGDKTHSNRQKALKLFKDSHVQILVATDVAARGLDIPNVSHVINYDLPSTYEDYVHRIGRTGRGNNVGKALTFVE